MAINHKVCIINKKKFNVNTEHFNIIYLNFLNAQCKCVIIV